MDEVSKTIQEREMLQKRTNDLLFAMQNKNNSSMSKSKTVKFANDPTVI